MSIQEVSAEQLARLCYHYREALTRNEAHRTEEDKTSWDCVSQQERRVMVAAVRLALIELASAERERQSNRKYFATPGEAEWDC